MTIDEARARVIDYVYGELSPDAAADFERLLEGDPSLAAEVEALRGVRRAVAGLPRPALPAEVRRNILFAARRRIAARRAERRLVPEWLERFLLSPAFSGAMVVVVALAAGAHIVGRFGEGDIATVEELERVEARRGLARQPAAAPSAKAPAPVAAEAVATPAAPSPAEERPGARRRTEAGGTTGGPEAEVARRETGQSGRNLAPAEVGPVTRGRPAPVRAFAVEPPGWSSGTEGGQFLGGDEGRADRKGGEQAVASPPSAAPRAPLAQPAASAATPVAKAGDAEDAPLPPAPPSAEGGALAPGLAREKKAAAAPDRAGEEEIAAGRKGGGGATESPEEALARARRLAAAGQRVAALRAYDAAISGLSGETLRAALEEAAAIADALGRKEVARGYRDRIGAAGSGTGQVPARPPAAAPAKATPAAPAPPPTR